jgi:hypothetical protein
MFQDFVRLSSVIMCLLTHISCLFNVSANEIDETQRLITNYQASQYINKIMPEIRNNRNFMM